MALTRKEIIATATADPGEILVVFDDGGLLVNWLLRGQADLKTAYIADPAGQMDAVFALAEEQRTAALAT